MGDDHRPKPSLDVVFDSLKGLVTEQDARFSLLEGKAIRTLGSSSILTGGVGILTTGLVTFTGANPKSEPAVHLGRLGNTTATELATVVIIAIFAAYVVLIWSTYKATSVGEYAVTGDADYLVNTDMYNPPEETKALLADSMRNTINQNNELLKEKARWTRWSIKAIAFQAGFTIIVGALQLWIV